MASKTSAMPAHAFSVAPPRTAQRPSDGPAQRRGQAELPPYQPISNTLTGDAHRELIKIRDRFPSSKLDGYLQEALKEMSASCGDMVDNLTTDKVAVSKLKSLSERHLEKHGEPMNQTELDRLTEMSKSLETMRTQVESMTQKMDESVRKLIDGKQAVAYLAEALNDTATVHTGSPRQTDGTQRSRRRLRNADGEVDDDESEDDNEYQDFTPTVGGPTQGDATTQNGLALPAPPSIALKTALQLKTDKYATLDLFTKYAQDNDYKKFKREIHESSYEPGTAPPMANERTWFKESGVPQPGMTTRAAGADDSDDDLAIAKETISTKCPLTLQEFRDPVTSTKCPHSFERDALMEMIDSPANAVRSGTGRGAVNAVQCPVPGCTSLLTKQDVQEDEGLKRRIVRLQRAARIAQDEADNEDSDRDGRDARRAERLSSDPIGADDSEDEGERDRPAKRMKQEKMRASGRGR